MRKLLAAVILIIAFVVAFYITVTPATGSSSCENDTGTTPYGLRVVFDRAVTITRMGSAFANWTNQKDGSVILFWNGSMYPSGRFSFFWEPKEADVLSCEWLPQLPGFAHFQKGNTRQLRHLVTKPAIELEDNRIGGHWHGLWEAPNLEAFARQSIDLGVKRFRVSINTMDSSSIHWDKYLYPDFGPKKILSIIWTTSVLLFNTSRIEFNTTNSGTSLPSETRSNGSNSPTTCT